MQVKNIIFLSYILDQDTPTYGDRNRFIVDKNSDICKGDITNDTNISTTVHIGTHIDMPYHFYENGQTIRDFPANFWIFNKTLFIDLKPKELIIKAELINILDTIEDIGYEILIVKTGICNIRNKEKFWNENFGFHPDLYDYLVKNFPSVRVFGFDSISVSSYTNRLLGRESHKRFLNPKRSILLLEDLDLRHVNANLEFETIIIAPLRIAKSDGLPCTVMGLLND